MPRRPIPIPSYDRVVSNYRGIFAGMSAASLLAHADDKERAYRRWKASAKPPAREYMIGALYGIRAYRKLARERATVPQT